MTEKLVVEFDILQRLELEIRLTEKRLDELHAARRLILELRATPLPEAVYEALPEQLRAHSRRPGAVSFHSLKEPGLSIPDAAAIVLQQAGEPMGVQELAERMLRGGYPYRDGFTPEGQERLKQVLRASIGRRIREGDTFTSEGRGLFGLLEWDAARAVRVPERRVPDYDEIETTLAGLAAGSAPAGEPGGGETTQAQGGDAPPAEADRGGEGAGGAPRGEAETEATDSPAAG